jgi:hypothetical protein
MPLNGRKYGTSHRFGSGLFGTKAALELADLFTELADKFEARERH